MKLNIPSINTIKLKIPSNVITIFEASLMIGIAVLAAIFPPLAAVCCGVSIAVTSFTLYGEQREVLKGDQDEDGAISVFYKHLVLSSLVFITLLLLSANPILGPIVPFIALAWSGCIAISLISSLCAGGYAKLQKTWKDSGIWPLMAFIRSLEFILSFIPSPIANVLGTAFARMHHWIGPFFFTAQIALFITVAALGSPAVGVAGLGYFGISFLRTQNLLPTFIANGLNKFDYWAGLFAGIFIPDFLMKIYTYYSIASTFISKLVFPRIAKKVLGKDYKFFEIKENEPTKKLMPQVPKNISLDNFKKLLSNISAPKEIKSDANSGREGDINNLWKEFLQFRSEQPAMKKRQETYAAFASLKSSPKTADKIKYYSGYIPMSIYWYSISAIYYPGVPNKFFNHKSQSNPYAVTVAHISNAPIILPPAPEVDFDEFMQLVKNIDFGKNLSVLKAECFESSKFQSIDKSLKDKLQSLQDKKANIKNLRKSQKELDKLIAQYNAEVCVENQQKLKPAIDKMRKQITKDIAKLTYVDLDVSNDSNSKKTTWLQKLRSMIRNVYLKIMPRQQNNSVNNQQEEDLEAQENLVLAQDAIFSDAHYQQEEASIESKVADVHLQMLTACKSFLNLADAIPVDTDDGQQKILSAYVHMRMQDVCESIKTGQGLGWGKAKKEIENLQTRGRHVIKFCQEMAQDPEENYVAELIVRQLALEAGGFCATGVDDVIFTLYDTYIANKFIEQGNYTTIQKFALYAQYYRKYVFNTLYWLLPTYKSIKAVVFHMSFDNRHDRATVLHAFPLQIDQRGGDLADARKEGTDLLKELGSKAIVLALIRLMITCEKGYSPEGIINGLLVTEPVQCYQAVWPKKLFDEWANGFNPEIAQYIQEIWRTGAAMAVWKDDEDYILLQKLLAFMLIDTGILEINNPEDKQKFDELLTIAATSSEPKLELKPMQQPESENSIDSISSGLQEDATSEELQEDTPNASPGIFNLYGSKSTNDQPLNDAEGARPASKSVVHGSKNTMC